ncbi:hypothetical protein [Lonepinella sp. BR2271]|uniref:hypothetical protein n=1 Tax=Lonepinella sp. BR2271 TaxID=3434550 RepID=UPI003F6E1AEC
MRKLLKKTALSLLISAAISSSVVAADVDSIFTYTGYTPYTSPINVTDDFSEHWNKSGGSLTFRIANTGGAGTYSFLGLSDPSKPNTYLAFYVNRNGNKSTYGVEWRNGGMVEVVWQ